MKQLTSLGRLFSVHGISDWEEIFPEKICSRCFLKRSGECVNDCAAIKVIGGLAVIAVRDQRTARGLITNFKEVIDNI